MRLMTYKVESYGISDVGLSRSNNEDVWAELPRHHFFALADGMGGHLGGEVAAKEAVLQLCDSIDELFAKDPAPSLSSIVSTLKCGIEHANKWIRNLSKQYIELTGMGTTLCCLLIYEQTLIHAHIGDSRIYKFKRGLHRLTEDHSLRQELISNGDLDEHAAALFPLKNIITRALGTMPSVKPEFKTTSFEVGDIFFLCSDGLTDAISETKIEAILQKHSSIKEASLELVEAAKAAGGSDNITIVMTKIIEA